MNERKRVSILGVLVDALNLNEAVALCQRWVAEKKRYYICFSPAHAILGAHDDYELKTIYNQSDLNAPDGMPIAWFVKAAGYPATSRVYGPDVMKSLLSLPGYRHYFYGGTPETVAALISKTNAANQFDLNVVGIECPPFRPTTKIEEELSCQKINQAQADFLWIGIGSPQQEKWIRRNRDQINTPVILGVGAAFDFLSGHKKQAPPWLQKMGLEWFFRLCSEPRRLFRRYLLGYPRFVVLVLLQVLKLRKFY